MIVVSSQRFHQLHCICLGQTSTHVVLLSRPCHKQQNAPERKAPDEDITSGIVPALQAMCSSKTPTLRVVSTPAIAIFARSLARWKSNSISHERNGTEGVPACAWLSLNPLGWPF